MATILLVEDDRNTSNLYKQILEKQGYQVEVAEDGEAGLNKIKTENFDLVLLDVMLPKMDGLAILAAVRKEPSGHTNKIVLLTNLTHSPIIEEARALGATDYIDKASTNPDDFIDRVKKLLVE